MGQRAVTTVIAALSLVTVGCAGQHARPGAPTPEAVPAAESSTTQEDTAPSTLDEVITVVNTLPIAVEVSVVSNLASGESTTERFGPIAPDGSASHVAKVQSGGSFVVQAHGVFDDVARTSNAFTATLEPGLQITPVRLTLGATFPKPTLAQCHEDQAGDDQEHEADLHQERHPDQHDARHAQRADASQRDDLEDPWTCVGHGASVSRRCGVPVDSR